MFSLNPTCGRDTARSATRRTTRATKPGFDSLEGRQLLTGYVQWAAHGDSVSVYGTPGSDYMTVNLEDQSTSDKGDDVVVITMTTTGTPGVKEARIPAGLVRSLRASMNNGNDTFMNNTPIPTVVYGGEGNDTLWGGSGKDEIYGGAGNDYLRGLQGNDSLFGEDGLDRLEGDEDNDLLDGGKDGFRDKLIGGTGADKFVEHNDSFSYRGIVYYGVEQEEFVDYRTDEGDSRWVTD